MLTLHQAASPPAPAPAKVEAVPEAAPPARQAMSEAADAEVTAMDGDAAAPVQPDADAEAPPEVSAAQPEAVAAKPLAPPEPELQSLNQVAAAPAPADVAQIQLACSAEKNQALFEACAQAVSTTTQAAADAKAALVRAQAAAAQARADAEAMGLNEVAAAQALEAAATTAAAEAQAAPPQADADNEATAQAAAASEAASAASAQRKATAGAQAKTEAAVAQLPAAAVHSKAETDPAKPTRPVPIDTEDAQAVKQKKRAGTYHVRPVQTLCGELETKDQFKKRLRNWVQNRLISNGTALVISAECAKEWSVPEGLELWTHQYKPVRGFLDWNDLVREGIGREAKFTLEIFLREPETWPEPKAPAGTPPNQQAASSPGAAHKADAAPVAMADGPAHKAAAGSPASTTAAHAAGILLAQSVDGHAAGPASGASSQVLQRWLQQEQAEAADAGPKLPKESNLLMAGHGNASHIPWPADGYPLPPQSLGTSPGYEHVVWQEFVNGMPSLSCLMACQHVTDLLNKLQTAKDACKECMPAKTLWDLLPPQLKPVYRDSARPVCIRLGNLTGGLLALDRLLKQELPRLNVKDATMLYQPNWFGETMFADILLPVQLDLNHAAVLVHHFQGKESQWSELEPGIRMAHICLPQVCALFPCLAHRKVTPWDLCTAMFCMFGVASNEYCHTPCD